MDILPSNKRTPLNVGNFMCFNKCRFCFGEGLKKVIDFGYVPLAGGFFPKGSKEKDFVNENYYPLQIYFCPNCYLLQSTNVISPKILFKKYFYFSSSMTTLENHFKEFADDLKKMIKSPKKKKILEIGCNDGVFLKPLLKSGFRAIGVDPAENIVKPLIKEGFEVVNAFFGKKSALKIKSLYGSFDVITGTSSLAHIDDMHDVLRGVTHLLKSEGIFIMEEHYMGSLLSECQYDMMYHEHPSYYGLLSLSNFLNFYGMHIFKVKYSPIRAGLMRYYIKYKGNKVYKIDRSVKKYINLEKSLKYDKLKTYLKFRSDVNNSKYKLLKLLQKIKRSNKNIIGYGASGRATIVSAFCGLSQNYLDFIIDDAPQKLGVHTPFNHLKVHSSDILNDKSKRPDYTLLFAWPFWNEIKNKNSEYLKNGGKFIIPLPKLKIISR